MFCEGKARHFSGNRESRNCLINIKGKREKRSQMDFLMLHELTTHIIFPLSSSGYDDHADYDDDGERRIFWKVPTRDRIEYG